MSKKRILVALATVGLTALLSTQAFAGFLEGKKAYDKADWMTAIMNLRPLVEAGDARAAVLLGNMYLDGHGVNEDAVEAASLYRKAALAHNTDAMVALAVLYQKGRGVDINIPVSRGWYERAARLGNQPAAFLYALPALILDLLGDERDTMLRFAARADDVLRVRPLPGVHFTLENDVLTVCRSGELQVGCEASAAWVEAVSVLKRDLFSGQQHALGAAERLRGLQTVELEADEVAAELPVEASAVEDGPDV